VVKKKRTCLDHNRNTLKAAGRNGGTDGSRLSRAGPTRGQSCSEEAWDVGIGGGNAGEKKKALTLGRVTAKT